MPEIRTYQGASLEELLPQIRAELGAGAVITRRREGVTGGFAGFFGKRCVEVEAQAGTPTPAVPTRSVFDAYDVATGGEDDDGGPVMRSLIEQASPFADALDEALAQTPAETAPAAADGPDRAFETLDLVSANGAVEVAARHVPAAGFEDVCSELVAAGMPRSVVDDLVRDASRMLAPFDPDASPADLVRRMLARRMRVEHGWHTKTRVIALVGPAGSGKTLTAAKLAHAYAARSPFTVRTVSLEPGEGADRLATLTEGLELDRRQRRHGRIAQVGGTRTRSGRARPDRHAAGVRRGRRGNRVARPSARGGQARRDASRDAGGL